MASVHVARRLQSRNAGLESGWRTARWAGISWFRWLSPPAERQARVSCLRSWTG